MKIIGVQILEGTNPSIRKSLELGWYPLIKCKNNIKLNDKDIPVLDEDFCPDEYYKINKELPSISVSAIVGKNGSGKSSLLEIIYRILNNFAATLLIPMQNSNYNTEIHYTKGLEARFFFELDGQLKYIYNHNSNVDYYEVLDGKSKEVVITDLSQTKCNDILRGFFYTIAINYSLYALNCVDYEPIISGSEKPLNSGEWLNHMFHKNDGYYIPIVLTPYRDNGEIKINNENSLALQRLSVLSLLFQSQGKNFIDGYIPVELHYMYNEDYKTHKTDSFRINLKKTFPVLTDCIDLMIRHFEEAWAKLIEEEPNLNLVDGSNSRYNTIIFFLAYKSIKICLTYPSFREMFKLKTLLSLAEYVEAGKDKKVRMVKSKKMKQWLNEGTDIINEIVRKHYTEKSHITMKIHQCINYIKNERYKDDGLHSVSYDDLIGKNKYKTYDEVFLLLPPAFFKIDLKLRKKARGHQQINNSKPDIITLQTMSSGERQLLYSMSYIFYHLKNIASVQEDGKRVGYHHINLIFDEVELYYHPEFQRVFMKRLLDNLALCNIDQRIIRSINIIIVTHSPFLLSDIPETNILFLGNEEQEANQKTFGANIYDLLKNGFFMESAIGGFAEQKLNDLMNIYYSNNTEIQEKEFKAKYNELKFTSEHIADAYLSKSFLFMFHELEQKYKPNNAKLRMEKEIQDMEIKINNLRKKLK